MRECQIPFYTRCCCTCNYRYIDRSHPGTDGKSACATRGYICAEPFTGYTSGWHEHGMCESHEEREEKPVADKNDSKSQAEAEHWDARFQKRDSLLTFWRLQRESK